MPEPGDEAVRDAREAVLTGRASRSDNSFKRSLDAYEAAIRARERKAWADYAQAVMEFWNANRSGPAVWTEKTEAARVELREAISVSERAKVEALVTQLESALGIIEHGAEMVGLDVYEYTTDEVIGEAASAIRAALDAARAGRAS